MTMIPDRTVLHLQVSHLVVMYSGDRRVDHFLGLTGLSANFQTKAYHRKGSI
jgi:hypothetical protein